MSGAVRSAAAVADSVRRPPAGLVILGYHRVGRRSQLSIDLPTALFGEHMAHLAAQCRTVSLDDGVRGLAGGGAGRDGTSVAVTFDDGTADFVDEALPVLVRNGVPATLYVATDFVESGRAFPHDGRPVSWAGLAEAVSTGLVEIGSHTHTHLLLDRVDGPTAAAELDRSMQLIGDRLGVACRHFAYPKARRGSVAAEAEVRARFESAALSGARPNPWRGSDLHRLARTPVQDADSPGWFARKASGGMRLEGDLRAVLDACRYRRTYA